MNYFLMPGSLRRSGGTLYNRQLIGDLEKSGWQIKVLYPGAIAMRFSEFKKDDLFFIDGLVFHQHEKIVRMLNRFRKIYVTHLPFWLEPGIASAEHQRRKQRETDFMLSCESVICTGEFISGKLRESGIPAGKIRVIPPDFFSPETSVSRNYKAVPKNWLVAGAVHYGKGYDVLFMALDEIRSRDWHLNIAGYFDAHDPYFLQLNKRIKKSGWNGRVNFLGECGENRLRELYDSSGLLIHPSRLETFGMAVGEAVSRGLPVLCSDAGALPEVYRDMCIFFRSEDEKDLAQNLAGLLKAGFTERQKMVFRENPAQIRRWMQVRKHKIKLLAEIRIP